MLLAQAHSRGAGVFPMGYQFFPMIPNPQSSAMPITLNVIGTGEHVARACGRVVFSNGQLCDVVERFP